MGRALVVYLSDAALDGGRCCAVSHSDRIFPVLHVSRDNGAPPSEAIGATTTVAG